MNYSHNFELLLRQVKTINTYVCLVVSLYFCNTLGVKLSTKLYKINQSCKGNIKKQKVKKGATPLGRWYKLRRIVVHTGESVRTTVVALQERNRELGLVRTHCAPYPVAQSTVYVYVYLV